MRTTLETLKKHARKPSDINAGFNGDGANRVPVVYTNTSDQFTETEAHKIIGLRYTGWFTNPDGETFRDGSGLCRGMVAEFPPRPGFPDGWFLAGYWIGDSGETVYALDVYGDREEAASEGDRMAERVAETEREYKTKWREARDIEEATETALQRLRECLVMRHRACMGYVREEARELCETIRGNRARLASDFADFQ